MNKVRMDSRGLIEMTKECERYALDPENEWFDWVGPVDDSLYQAESIKVDDEFDFSEE